MSTENAGGLVEGQLVERFGEYEITIAPDYQREFRFNFCHVDYDGPGDKRCGFDKTVQGCRDQISDIESDLSSRCSNDDCNEIVADDAEFGLCDSCRMAREQWLIRETDEQSFQQMRRFK